MKHMLFFLICTFFLVSNLLFPIPYPILPHDIHVSKCQIKFQEASNDFQISVQFYVDDLQTSLAQKDITINIEKAIPEAILSDYLKAHFKIQVDGTMVDFDLVKQEFNQEELSLSVHLKTNAVGTFKEMVVFNSMLMDTFDDQQVVLKIEGPNNNKGYFLLDKANQEVKILF